MDRPGKAEWYSGMMVACEVRRVLSTQPSQHQPNQFRLTFVDPEDEDNRPLTDEDLDELKARDMAAFGKGGRYTPPPEPDPETDQWEDPIE